VLGVLVRIIRQGKEIKGFQMAKVRVKWSLSSDSMSLHTENPEKSTKNCRTNKFTKVAD
jgi:hypothetical protein